MIIICNSLLDLYCNKTSMSLRINKTKLEMHGRDYEIMFQGESHYPCKINGETKYHSNNGMIWINSSYNECGIKAFASWKDGGRNGEIIYNQTIVVVYGKNPNSTIVYREEKDEFHVKCQLNRRPYEQTEITNISEKESVLVSKG